MTWWVHDLTVRFADLVALDHVSLDLEPGRLHAVIGGDGSGKTTLLKALAGLDVGQSGTTRLPAPDRISYLPSAGGIFGDLTLDENIAFVAAAYGTRGWRSRADDLLERAGIATFRDRLAAHLSGGQQRKLAGCMALLPDPELLVLDEITTGVDPVSRLELWRLLAGAAAGGTAVIVATTYLDEAERMERVLLLHEGHVLATGSPDAIVASIPGVVIDADRPTDRARSWRAGHRWRTWIPDPTGATSGARTRFEDAAIVLELIADGDRVGAGDGA